MEAYTEELFMIATKNEFRIHAAFALMFRGHLMTMIGRPEEGLRYLADGFTKLHESGTMIGRVTYHFPGLAEAHISLNNPAQALEYLTEAVQIIGRTEERVSEAEIFRLRGDALNAIGDIGQAENSYRRALETARCQRAKLLELRAVKSMSRLLCGHNRHEEAKELLNEMCNWFVAEKSMPLVKQADDMLAQLTLPAASCQLDSEAAC
jgi:tetratricopeptide (TPR) repeat protein